ncbi:MAG TPA: Calx-beta domain-containing protein [Chitinophagaceae bacterium]|nr:Calx-beta domain-containing protein [Chitinophagaceae bacterium]
MKHYLLLLCYLIIHQTTLCQPGTLDSSFANQGTIIDKRTLGWAYTVAIQNDGKIIAGGRGTLIGNSGSFVLYRYNTDGSNDSSFGINGMAETRFSVFAKALSLAIQSDGKILATGYVGSDIGIVRYQQNGLLDSSFGSNGISITDLGAGEYNYVMALQTDGKIVVTGFISANSHDDQRAFVARFLSNDTLDDSFGNNGTVITEFNAQIEIKDIALQPDGKIITGGTYDPYLRARYCLARYLTNGILDSSFGNNGIAVSDFGERFGDGGLYALALQKDGKIIGAGNGDSPNSGSKTDMQMIRFNNDGSVDSGFGLGGRAFAVFGNTESAANDVLVQQDGKIILAGYISYNFSDNTEFALARFSTTGSLDSSFGENGLQRTAITQSCVAYSAALQKDGKIVLAGNVYVDEPPAGNYFGLARYNNDPTQISITKNIKVTEGNAGNIPATFRLALNNTSALPVKVKYKTVNGTAIAGTDYIADSGMVTIKAGKTMAKITIDVIGNNMQEPNKKFYLQIGEPVNAELGALTIASCTIKNDDALRTGYNNLTLPAIKISPNPVKDVLQLQGLDANSDATITIVNIQGTVMDASSISNSSSYTKNIAQLHHGTYYIKIQQNEKVSTVMFMKE